MSTHPTLFSNVLVLSPPEGERPISSRIYKRLDVLFVDGKIESCESHSEQIVKTFTEKYPNLETIDGTKLLMLAGFVNAHTHSSEVWSRGRIPDLPLELWLVELIDQSEPCTPEMVYLGAKLTGIETLRSGGTSILDHLSLIPGKEEETVEAAVRAYREIGIRAFIAPLIGDLPVEAPFPSIHPKTPEPVPGRTQFLLDLMEKLVEKFHRPSEGINIGVGPTGLQLCSDDLFRGCIKISDKYNLFRHSHVLETSLQQDMAQKRYGCTPVEHLNSLGYLNERTSCAHAIHLNSNDMEILASTKSTIVHNPLSNLRLGSGNCPLIQYKEKNVSIAIGCDGAASNDSQDVLEAIKIGSQLHRISEKDYRKWIHPWETLEMASRGGAGGLGQTGNLGVIAKGAHADVFVVNLETPPLSLLPRTEDPVRMLVFGRHSAAEGAFSGVWVAGKRIVGEKGEMLTTDIEQLKKDLYERSPFLAQVDTAWDPAVSSTLPFSPLREYLEPAYRASKGLSP